LYDKPGVGDWQVLRPDLCLVGRGTEDRTFGQVLPRDPKFDWLVVIHITNAACCSS
jgi:hypothetical protein